MNVAELKTAVKSFGYGTEDDTFIVTWLNLAYKDVASRRRWHWLEANTTVSTTANAEVSVLSTNLYAGIIRSVTAGLTSPTYYDSASEAEGSFRVGSEGGSARRGVPLRYTIRNSAILWDPIPDAVYTYRLEYWAVPTELSADGDTPSHMPANDHQVLIWGACMYAAMRDHDPGRAQMWESRYEAKIRDMAAKDHVRTDDSKHMYLPRRYYGVYDIR